MKINESELSQITEKAYVYYKDTNKPVLMTDSDFRCMCFAKSTIDLLVKKGYLKNDVQFPEERVTFSVFED